MNNMNELLGKKHCEQHTEQQDYEGKLLIIKPEKLKEQYRNPIVQYFYATSGFGCKYVNGDKKVFGQFLADGLKEQLYRSDFIGVADKTQLPSWAAKRLEILENPKMKIRVFQLKSGSDNLFMNYDHTMSHGGIQAEKYMQVYGGEVLADSLEEVFTIGNTDQPCGYLGRSLSVSDVIEVCEGKEKGFYFVDSFGFKKIENDRRPYTAEIRREIHAMQSVVGGCIEPVYFEPKGDALCWCNDEFLLNGSAPNRKIGEVLVHGTCYISGDSVNEYGEYDSCSLTDEQIERYKEMFPQSVICLDRIEDMAENESECLTQNMD